VDTSNPPGNELLGAKYLAALLSKEGIESEFIEHRPGRASLIARLRGNGTEAPLCLLSHIDVVPANASAWPEGKGPFSGTIDDEGMIWGRGALDMKGMGAIQLMTMLLLKRLGVPLRRDIVLLAVADEEVDNFGAREIAEKHWDKVGCSHLVNEGGLGIRDLFIEGQTLFAISVAEKGLLWVRMVARGEAGHGSTPLPGRAPDRLVRALGKLSSREDDPYITPSLYQMLAEAGHHAGGIEGFVLRRPSLVNLMVMDKLLANPPARAAITNTVSVTGFEGSEGVNVVPSEVAALLDCRLLPGKSPATMLAELRSIIDDPEIELQILQASPATENDWDDPLYRALVRHTLDGRPHAAAGPILSPGFTDSIFFRKRGVKAYGLIPFEVTKEEAATMHGRNERVSVANVRDGLKVLYRAVVDVSAVERNQKN
jgi:acetylornithine deacetylase/succinyl-diaminopimelate desuccinylase-like protein